MYAYLAETQSYNPLFLEQHDWGLRSLSLGLKPNSSSGVSIFQLLYQADGFTRFWPLYYLYTVYIIAKFLYISTFFFFLEVELIYPKILHITLTQHRSYDKSLDLLKIHEYINHSVQ